MVLLAGCSTAGNLGIVIRSSADPISILKAANKFEELGFVEGKACRHFVLALIPWGNSDFQTAVDDALVQNGGDALVNQCHHGKQPVWIYSNLQCVFIHLHACERHSHQIHQRMTFWIGSSLSMKKYT